MKPFESRARETVTRLIEKYGFEASWKSSNPSTFDDPTRPSKPTAVAPTPHDVTVVFLSSDLKTREFQQYMQGMEIPEGYQRALMAVQTFTPKLKDKIVANGKTLSVDWLDPVQPAGNVLLWKMGLAT